MITDGITGPSDEPAMFAVNDRVSYGGMEGTVVNYEPDHQWRSSFPVKVRFDCGYEIVFTEDGRQFIHQKESLLKVIGKVKPKVKRWQWLQRSAVTGNIILTSGVYTEEEAREFKTFIRKIEETEIEEDQ